MTPQELEAQPLRFVHIRRTDENGYTVKVKIGKNIPEFPSADRIDPCGRLIEKK